MQYEEIFELSSAVKTHYCDYCGDTKNALAHVEIRSGENFTRRTLCDWCSTELTSLGINNEILDIIQ